MDVLVKHVNNDDANTKTRCDKTKKNMHVLACRFPETICMEAILIIKENKGDVFKV